MDKIYDDLFELIDTLKQSKEYLLLKDAEKKLEDPYIKEILTRQKFLHEKYLSLKQHEDKTDLSLLRKELSQIKQEVSLHPIIKEYYDHYHTFNQMLSKISSTLFENISDEMIFSPYKMD